MIDAEIVVAVDEDGGIGKEGGIPWRLRADLRHLKKLTVGDGGNAVVMGRKTWESLPDRFRPLPERHNVVVSRRRDYPLPAGVRLAHDPSAVWGQLASDHRRLFCLGGSELYRHVLDEGLCQTVHLTQVEGRHGCDTFFPPMPTSFRCVERGDRLEEKGLGYVFERWTRTSQS